MNQVGKIRAPTGAVCVTFSSWRGGVYNSSVGTSRSRRSFAARRGSSIFSRRMGDQSCNPDTITEWSGKSSMAPGP